ncbi:MAG: hypothetical protein JNK74_10510 [Candidatus Hydrogenedentes bacterium]|nr:hypothetical protein [Candidatus Hydrogenedentota bacterium]
MSVQLIAFIALLGVNLPTGSAPEPLTTPHFPDALHAFVWRNWDLVPMERMADAVDATPAQLTEIGHSMGLTGPPAIGKEQEARSYITVIRRNWHLLPYDQMLTLLNWDAEKLDFVLREDDFLFIKFGSLKPNSKPITYAPPTDEAKAQAAQIAKWVKQDFPDGLATQEPLFQFVKTLSAPFENTKAVPKEQHFNPRFCAPYFGLYGDPLEHSDIDPFPPAYLERVKASGVSGIWIPALLYQLAPFPWEPEKSEGYEKRLEYLNALVNRVKASGVDIYLYLNEPRGLPHAFFEKHPELKGVSSGEITSFCTSLPEVQTWLRDSVATVSKAVPNLGGFFTISASENLTSCWSHGKGADCPRCKDRTPAEVIAEVNTLIWEGIEAGGGGKEFFVWDWGWNNAWAPDLIARLPKEVALMSVSEWDLPIVRGGIESSVGEYSLSSVGPGPRATAHWKVARDRGMKTMAKIQANITWEISSVPYVPAVANAAEHARRLREAGVEGIMLGWTLGGHPSPNLEVFSAMGSDTTITPEAAMKQVAVDRFGEALAPAVVKFWQSVSTAYSEYPYHIGTMYSGPQQVGPSNLLWGTPTGYGATMVCFPYDNLDAWRVQFPRDIFIKQFTIMAEGFNGAADALAAEDASGLDATQKANLAQELRITRACALHFQSVADQAAFIVARDALAKAEGDAKAPIKAELERLLKAEIETAKKMHALQSVDSRLGFEASNHYFYIPADLVEKVINCEYLLSEWLPKQ